VKNIKHIAFRHILGGPAIALAGLAGAVTEAAEQQGQVQQGQVQQAPTDVRGGAGRVEEVIVTAQRRSERLQDVPISISVLGGDDLDRITADGLTEILNRVPGVATTAALQGGGTLLSIRGVAAGGPLFNGSSPIGYYLDEVPFGLVKTAVAPDSNPYDLDRLEVLRGPQGTLYGASALNGVVRVLTHDADVDTFEFKARTALSTTKNGGENYRGDIAVNAPIVAQKLAARVVLGYENLSGWIDTPAARNVNDSELRNARLKINAQPTEQFSIGASAWISRADYGAPSASNDAMLRTSIADESIETDYDVYGLHIGYEFANFSIRSITGYLDYSNGGDLDLQPLTGVPGTLFTGLESEVFSQEFLLNSKSQGPWRWSLGGIYRDAEDRLLQDSAGFPVPIDFSDKSESFAVFGELTRTFLDNRLELTGGLRYFEDDVTQIENVPQSGNLADPVIINNDTFDKVSPRLVLTWLPSSNTTVYASYAQGFRSGFNQNANIIRQAPEFPPLDADTLKNYELGTKGTLAEGRFTYEAAVYYIDWEDVQQTISVEVNGLPTTVLVNGESASGAGFEFSIAAQPIEAWFLSLSFSWNDLTSDSSVVSAGVPLFDKGDRLNFSPEYTAGAATDYLFPFGDGRYEAKFSLSANYISEQTYRNVAGDTRFIEVGEPLLIARASLAIESVSGWTATLFVENLNDEDDPGIGLFNVPDWPQRTRPRTIGLQLEYRM